MLSKLKTYQRLNAAGYEIMGLSILFVALGIRKKSKKQKMKELIEEIYRRKLNE